MGVLQGVRLLQRGEVMGLRIVNDDVQYSLANPTSGCHWFLVALHILGDDDM